MCVRTCSGTYNCSDKCVTAVIGTISDSGGDTLLTTDSTLSIGEARAPKYTI